MNARALAVPALALLSLAVGFGIGISLRSAPEPSAPPSDSRLEAENAALRAEVEDLKERLGAVPPPAPAREDGAIDAGRVEAGLPEGAPAARVDEATALAERIREDALTRAAGAEIEAARRVAQAMEEERRFLEDRARGGTMALLRGLAEDEVHLPELVADPRRFGEIFTRHEKGPVLDRTDGELPDGAEISLGAGVHSFDVRRFTHEAFPKDLLVRGAGMDETLLVLNELSTRDEVASLTFKDLTIDCRNDYMTDLRHESPATIRVIRCRIVGFDMGAGGSVMFAASTGAFLAEDSRIEAGFSRATPGFGNLFRVRSGLLVRMDRCVIRGPFRSVFDRDDGATYHFSACRFEEMETRLRREFETPPEGVRFHGCTFEYTETPHADRKKRELSEINAGW